MHQNMVSGTYLISHLPHRHKAFCPAALSQSYDCFIYIICTVCLCVQTKGALAAAAAASAVAAQVARGRGRAALARGAFVSAAAPGYVTPGTERIAVCVILRQ